MGRINAATDPRRQPGLRRGSTGCRVVIQLVQIGACGLGRGAAGLTALQATAATGTGRPRFSAPGKRGGPEGLEKGPRHRVPCAARYSGCHCTDRVKPRGPRDIDRLGRAIGRVARRSPRARPAS